MESSGLSLASFPVEVGWAIVRPDLSIDSGALLIQPMSSWLTRPGAWEVNAEGLHGLSRARLQREGLAPATAARRLLDALAGAELAVSDMPLWDAFWLRQLWVLLPGGTRLPLHYAERAFDPRWVGATGHTRFVEGFDTVPETRHRAEPDARALAQLWIAARGAHLGVPAGA